MDDDGFWRIIESGHRDHLARQLSTLPLEELEDFDQRLQAALNAMYTWDLWAVAYLAQGGCSDDCFEYFRAWVVTQGRDAFERARSEPFEFGMSLDPDPGPTGREAEWILYMADEQHRSRTGAGISRVVRSDSQPRGEEWDEETVHLSHPELAEHLGWDRDEPTAVIDVSDIAAITLPHYEERWNDAVEACSQVIDDPASDDLSVAVATAISGHALFHLGDEKRARVQLLEVLEDPDRRDLINLVMDELSPFAYPAAVLLHEQDESMRALALLEAAVNADSERNGDTSEETLEFLAKLRHTS